MKLTKKMIKEAIAETIAEADSQYPRVYRVFIYKENERGKIIDEIDLGIYETDHPTVRAAREVAAYGWDDGEGWQVEVEQLMLNFTEDNEIEARIRHAAKALSKEVGFSL